MPVPQLLYAQVIKTTRRRRLVRVTHRAVFGTLAAIEQVLAAHGWQINTAFIERVNLTIRQHVAAVGRRVMTLCKGEAGLRQQLACITPTTIFACPMPACASPSRSPNRPRQWFGQALAATVRQPWLRADRSRLDATGGAAVPRPAVATAAGL